MEKMEGEKGLGDQPKPRDSYKIAYVIHFCLPGILLSQPLDGWGNKLTCCRLRMKFSMFVLSSDWVGRPKGAYGLTVASVVVCGLADGLTGRSLIGSAGKLPIKYMQVVCSCLHLEDNHKGTTPTNPQGLRTSAHFYFIVTVITLMCCTLCCNFLYNLPVMEQYFKLLSNDNSWPVFRILIIYVVTLLIFPGFLAESLASKLLQDRYPVLLITVYNVSDFMGKSLTAIYIAKSIKKATRACILWLFLVVVLTFMLGASNGYLTSFIMILAPKSVPVLESESSAIVLIVFLGLELVGG
ncbi:hypothetical protein P3X46_031574 [Hevea brasiliensis]|uniref:Uncharacterized protein n=1 Tax=Hevea brasiliensis TaxID=3981 RepID=A0ABQ9KMQ2_HEVBR|nr:hypothetical protein P3X46_031574 [Hevea brasiliensis]